MIDDILENKTFLSGKKLISDFIINNMNIDEADYNMVRNND
ncbi:hypothetical protein BA1DRAFT_02473 [Photorhabdus aegyptia]|uniref:Uncharacterized protein n=1 Tax=Photorhabdus aegyptia TaxID=2805098 RepID=A0A022PKG7_9GAMM|nr:hypothetical protein BA1DRAFT_02473 [Photorhabdus aegyptia]